jgi:hypothetical protein
VAKKTQKVFDWEGNGPMANKKLFKSPIGRLMPVTDALNEERAPAYKLSPKHQLAQYAATLDLKLWA